MRKNKAAILAIGTEVTSGQIVNRNTAWLAERLEKLGLEVILHIAVPDERTLMLKALSDCQEQAEVVITCGGLGPTTDDFTREVIAEFLKLPLEFDQESCNKIEQKMKVMGRKFLDSQKRQCYFPKGSQIMSNAAGTADGFFVSNSNLKLGVLPGPPNEVAAIWDLHMEAAVAKHSSSGAKAVLKCWNCMGRPEAELAELIEKLVQGSKLKTGYRLNAPYVEIKIWCDPQDLVSQKTYFDSIDAALKEWLVYTDDNHPWDSFWNKLKTLKSVVIWDEASEGLFGNRLLSYLRAETTRANLPKITVVTGSKLECPSDFSLHITPLSSEGEFEVHLATPNKKLAYKRKSPFVHRLGNERSRLAAAELAVIAANQFLAAAET